MDADLVDLPARLKNVSRTEFDTVVTSLATFIDYENIRVSKLQVLRREDWQPARFRGLPWSDVAHGTWLGGVETESSVYEDGCTAHWEGAPSFGNSRLV